MVGAAMQQPGKQQQQQQQAMLAGAPHAASSGATGAHDRGHRHAGTGMGPAAMLLHELRRRARDPPAPPAQHGLGVQVEGDRPYLVGQGAQGQDRETGHVGQEAVLVRLPGQEVGAAAGQEPPRQAEGLGQDRGFCRGQHTACRPPRATAITAAVAAMPAAARRMGLGSHRVTSAGQGGSHAGGAAGSCDGPLVSGVGGTAYRWAKHTVSRTVAEDKSGIVLPASVVSALFPGIWRRIQQHLDACVKVQVLHLPVTLVLASLPEGDPGREVQVGGGVRGTVRRWMLMGVCAHRCRVRT